MALTSARLGGIKVGHADIAGDVPATTVLAATLVLLTALVRQELGAKAGARMLQAIGLDAAREAAERPAT